MFHKTKLNKAVITAIAAGMAASAGSLVMAAGIEEVIVTATKRAENMQDVAIGGIVHLSDIQLPKGVTVRALRLGDDHDQAIATITGSKGS